MEAIANSELPNAEHARAVLKGGGKDEPHLHTAKRVFNNAKVSDHFAIIPTGKVAKLNDVEQKVYDMVIKRFIAVFYPVAEFEATNRMTRITTDSATDCFKTDGKVLVVPGWLEVYGRVPGVAAGKDELVAVQEGESASTEALELLDEETRPPRPLHRIDPAFRDGRCWQVD